MLAFLESISIELDSFAEGFSDIHDPRQSAKQLLAYCSMAVFLTVCTVIDDC